MTITQLMFRQGDVLLVCVAALPADEVPAPAKGFQVLAEGEATGHCHYVLPEQGIRISPSEKLRRIAQEFGIQDARSIIGGLRVTAEQATLYHGTPTLDLAGPRDADHRAIALPVGDYIALCPREYTGEDDFRRIAD